MKIERLALSSKDLGNPVWPTNNEYGVPVLRLDLQADRLDAPVARWGRERRKSRMRGTWHFYTDDSRFARLWQRPTDLINSGCVAAVEPNFSVHAQTPRALALYATYRKRYLARVWQELGQVRVLVDLNVAAEHAETNLLGVPFGWQAYATRGSVERLEELEREWWLACARAMGDVLFVVYGGGQTVRRRCQERHWVWVPEEADAARGRPWVADLDLALGAEEPTGGRLEGATPATRGRARTSAAPQPRRRAQR